MEVLLPWGKSFLAPRWSVLVSTTAAASFSAEKKTPFRGLFLRGQFVPVGVSPVGWCVRLVLSSFSGGSLTGSL